MSGCLFLTALSQSPPAMAQSDELEFNRDIRPILSDKCFFCHGPDEAERKADLRLDTREGATAEIDGYQAIVPGNPDNSELVFRILSNDEDDVMPPHESEKSLSQDEKDRLIEWIRQGAPYEEHWAYQIPSPRTSNTSQDWIDSWIDKDLKLQGLDFAQEADPTTLVRRLYFDLTGLPPEPSVVEAFAENPDTEAYSRLVDGLLESEAFGERLASYWLDLVRYADTVGYHGDQDQNIAPYRDYVINAFNLNMPFDRFSMEQLAGDLMENPTVDQKIATGYNRLLQTTHEGGLQPKEYLAIYAADRVRNFSSVWMGATVGCAQCHDHKFDPYSIKDFYSIAAFFADVDEKRHFKEGTNSLPTKRPPEIDVLPISVRREIESTRKQLDNAPALSEDIRQSLEARIRELEQIRQRTMVTVSTEPRPMRVLPRGNWQDESGPVVTPSVPEFLGSLQTENRATRLDLAQWLFQSHDEGGIGELTARVFANRIWYLLMGRGLSESLDDFGGQGVPPTHPELLDQLALEFMASDWDIKALIRTVVSSRTYRQASITDAKSMKADPANKWFSRQSRFRVPAEMVRDTALKVSGLLVDGYSVASIRPYQPDGYYRHLNFPTRSYKADTDAGQWKRAVYVHWQRMFLHPMMKAFDAPTREECTAKRPQSNTPLASLTLLNDPTFIEAARSLAQQSLLAIPIPDEQNPSTDRQRIEWMFRKATSRIPVSQTELPLLKRLLLESRHSFAVNPDQAEHISDIGLSLSDESIPKSELAAWTQIARAVLNLNETYQRN